MVGHVSRRHSMSGRTRHLRGRSAVGLSGGCVCSPRGLLSSSDRHIAPRPCPRDFDRTPRAAVAGCAFGQMEDVFGTIGSPSCQRAVLVSIERAAAVTGHEPSVSHLELAAGRQRASRSRAAQGARRTPCAARRIHRTGSDETGHLYNRRAVASSARRLPTAAAETSDEPIRTERARLISDAACRRSSVDGALGDGLAVDAWRAASAATDCWLRWMARRTAGVVRAEP